MDGPFEGKRYGSGMVSEQLSPGLIPGCVLVRLSATSEAR